MLMVLNHLNHRTFASDKVELLFTVPCLCAFITILLSRLCIWQPGAPPQTVLPGRGQLIVLLSQKLHRPSM